MFESEECFQIISGDNESNLFLWLDDSENVFKQQIETEQENKAVMENLQFLKREANYGEALRLCFRKDLYQNFFKVIQEWVSGKQQNEVIYDIENEQFQYEQSTPKEELVSTIKELWEENPAKLFFLLKNFITRRKYQFSIDICLQIVLNLNKITQLSKINDNLKDNNQSLVQSLKAFQTFN